MGLTIVAAASRRKRLKPWAELLRISSLMRWVTSPMAMPPKVVAKTSLMAGGSTSPQNSHIRLPQSEYGALCQNERPLERAELKYKLP